jgi:hypothetical protein
MDPGPDMAQRFGHDFSRVPIQQVGATGSGAASTGGLIQRQVANPKCTAVEIATANAALHVFCNQPRRCSMQGDSCASATAKVAAGNGCVDLRTKLQQKCFSPGDPAYEDHMEQIAQASAALRNCIAVMTAKCAAEDAAKALLAAALVAAAAAAAAAAKKGLKGVAGRALIYAEVAAAVILLVSGKAEAKISLDGDSPLEALFKAMEQDGVPVPDELKKLIESDPELKKMLEDSAKRGGNLSDVQKRVAEKYAEYISKHINEFSKDDLRQLSTATDQVADHAPEAMNTEDIKKQLKARTGGKDGGEGEGKDGGKAGGKDQGGPSVRPADTESPKLSALSAASKQRIRAAPTAVAKLFKEFAAGQSGDTKLDDAVVQRFFEIVPPGLTDPQAEALIGRLQSSQGKSADAVLDALNQAVSEIGKDATPTTDDATGDITAGDQVGVSREQVIEQLKALAQQTDFTKVPERGYVIRRISDKIVNGKITAYFYGKFKGVGVVGYITGTVPAGLDVAKLKRGSKFAIAITSRSPFVDKNGSVHDLQLTSTVTVGR